MFDSQRYVFPVGLHSASELISDSFMYRHNTEHCIPHIVTSTIHSSTTTHDPYAKSLFFCSHSPSAFISVSELQVSLPLSNPYSRSHP